MGCLQLMIAWYAWMMAGLTAELMAELMAEATALVELG